MLSRQQGRSTPQPCASLKSKDSAADMHESVMLTVRYTETTSSSMQPRIRHGVSSGIDSKNRHHLPRSEYIEAMLVSSGLITRQHRLQFPLQFSNLAQPLATAIQIVHIATLTLTVVHGSKLASVLTFHQHQHLQFSLSAFASSSLAAIFQHEQTSGNPRSFLHTR